MTPEEAARHTVACADYDDPDRPPPWWLGVGLFVIGGALAFGGVAWWVEAIGRWWG